MKNKNYDSAMILFITVLSTISFFMVLTIYAYVIQAETPESTYILEVTPVQDYSAEDNKISFIDKHGHKWEYTKDNNICYYSGDEHLLVMADNSTPDNIKDDKIISIY